MAEAGGHRATEPVRNATRAPVPQPNGTGLTPTIEASGGTLVRATAPMLQRGQTVQRQRHFLALQRCVGNSAVQNLLAREPSGVVTAGSQPEQAAPIERACACGGESTDEKIQRACACGGESKDEKVQRACACDSESKDEKVQRACACGGESSD